MSVRNVYDRLIKKALSSPCRFKVSSIGFDASGDVIALKTNLPRFMHKGGGIHAEMALMRQYGGVLKSIVIIRVGSNGNLLPITPCATCLAKAKELGIKISSIKE